MLKKVEPPSGDRAARETVHLSGSNVFRLINPTSPVRQAPVTTLPIPLPLPRRFDYGAIDHNVADRLRTAAGNIRARARTITSGIIEIGAALIEVKDQFGHGQFTDWVEAECGFSIRAAQNYIAAANFAEGKNATVALLPPASVYRLAARSVPPEVVETILARVETGEVVAATDIDAMLVESRHRRREQDKRKKAAVRARVRRRHESQWEREKEEEAREAEATALKLFDLVETETLRTIITALDNWQVRIAVSRLLTDRQPPEVGEPEASDGGASWS